MGAKTETHILIGALKILANDIESADGVANACIYEAAQKLEELENKIMVLENLNMELGEEISMHELADN